MAALKTSIDTQNVLLSDIEKSLESLLMHDIFHKILRLAKMDVNVILVGEIGSGKKRLANVIHQNSPRSDKPFHSFYCIDVNENDYKDAFWGHLAFEKEAITLRYDALEKATGGVLYLDQFSELSPSLMLKIIRSLQKGCKQLFRFDNAFAPRLIISINQESYHDIVHTEVWKKLLRAIDPVLIMLPPLRERKEDIPVLVEHYLNEIKGRSADFHDLKISDEALKECANYSWPGNIRQLKNALLQGAILSYGKTIERKHLPFSMNVTLPYELDDKQ
jgi:DNA-binding NtrC family response regulator